MNIDTDEQQNIFKKNFYINNDEQELTMLCYKNKNIFLQLISLLFEGFIKDPYNLFMKTDKFLTIGNLQTNKIPLAFLYGGNSYYYYYDILNEANLTIFQISRKTILSIDFDISICLVNNYNRSNLKSFMINLIESIVFSSQLNLLHNFLDIINADKIKNNDFTSTMKYFSIKNNDFFGITYSGGQKYDSFHLNICYKNSIYQIVEILCWKKDFILDNNKIQNSILYSKPNKYIAILPPLSDLISKNIISLKNRLNNKVWNKCTKDIKRLLYFDNLFSLKIKHPVLLEEISESIKIYQNNKDIFTYPYKICDLHKINDDSRDIILSIYNKFINLNDKQKLTLFLSIPNLTEEEFHTIIKTIYKNK